MMAWLDAIEFREPWFLAIGLAALPVWLLSRRAPGRVVFSSLAVLPSYAKSWRMRLSWLVDARFAVSVVALAIALAGPRTADSATQVRSEGIAVMMVIDISGSMRALDLSAEDEERTRLDAVKQVFETFVHGGGDMRGRPDDAIGVVTFARYADTACPLTLDHSNLTTVARGLEIVTERSEDGTAVGDGLGLAVERLRQSPARSRVAILLTDGVNNAGDEEPLAAAELARTQGVKVYTIGAGTDGLAPVRVRDPFTGQMVLRPTRVEIDEKTLREVAERTTGKYFRATDADALTSVYEQIDLLERTELSENRHRQYHEYFPLALALGLAAACAAWLLRGTAFRRLP